MANARPAPDTYPIQSATAPDLSELARSVASEPPLQHVVEPQPVRLVYQRPLFHEMQHVMQIPVLPAADTRDLKPRSSRPRPPRRTHADQQSLDFGPRVRTSLEAVIYCSDPVASPAHRLIAAALDISLVLIALGAFVAIFQFAGGPVNLTWQTLPVAGAVAAGVWFFYNLLFSIAGGDTPGTHWAQLRLVNYDGQPPTRDERIYRVLASYLSMLAAGMGVVWALVDEENLTWHDHMTRTFPTFRE